MINKGLVYLLHIRSLQFIVFTVMICNAFGYVYCKYQ
jgi:hypothetical protein